VLTVGFIVVGLFALEHSFRFLLKDVHYLLEDEMNVKKVARHLGVDLVGLFSVAYIGTTNRHICQDLLEGCWSTKNKLHVSGYETRLFTYHPVSQQLLLVFLAYQIKNLYDSWVFDDGIEFILHHVFSGVVAWGGMFPGYAHFYAIFFMGISEISTTILILLSHFDPKFGIDGASEAFPLLKIAFAVAFVISFIICRTILWPFTSYHFIRDALTAIRLNSPHVQSKPSRKIFLQITIFALSGLSVLQVLWLFQIIIMAKQEFDQLMSKP
jgi:hypothetical protein